AFVDYFMKGDGLAQPWGVGWVAHTRELIQLRLRTACPFVFYEVLYEHPGKTVLWTLRELGTSVPVRRIMEAVGKTSYVRCDPSTLPVDVDMGSPGKWRHDLQPTTVLALEGYCGELMDELGYAR
ncbi:MAG: hypothetical protein GWN58_09000, partial [Anaerolineae bacterium]|nr:hypothetical protein [Anaerolineae bacterium]